MKFTLKKINDPVFIEGQNPSPPQTPILQKSMIHRDELYSIAKIQNIGEPNCLLKIWNKITDCFRSVFRFFFRDSETQEIIKENKKIFGEFRSENPEVFDRIWNEIHSDWKTLWLQTGTPLDVLDNTQFNRVFVYEKRKDVVERRGDRHHPLDPAAQQWLQIKRQPRFPAPL